MLFNLPLPRLSRLTGTLLIAAMTSGCRMQAATPPPAAPVRAAAARATPTPRPAVSEERLGELRQALREAVGRVPGTAAAVYWEDLETGQSVTVNADQVFKAASLIKMPVAAAALALWEREPSRRTPERERQLWRMVAESNNEAFDALAELVGGPAAVTRFCREQGWRGTEMNAYYRQMAHPPGPNQTTARDMAALLRALDRRQLVSPAASEELWRCMLDQTHVQRIPAGIPADAGVEVGNKTGTIRTVLHDIAIVRAPRAHYLLCLLTANQRSDPAGNRWCKDVSRLVWDAVTGESVDDSDELEDGHDAVRR